MSELIMESKIDDHKKRVDALFSESLPVLKKVEEDLGKGKNRHRDENKDNEGTQVWYVSKFQAIRKEYEKQRPPVMTFYGLYNAGKSTLINALFQDKVAETGDTPTTKKISDPIRWEGFELIDTPGINANNTDTVVANREISKSDVILFVVDNSDSFDNDYVYQTITRILNSGKALAIVLNQKNKDEEEDPNTPVPELPSIVTIEKKIFDNLERALMKQGRKLKKTNNFINLYPIDAETAFESSTDEKEIKEFMQNLTGMKQLRAGINKSIAKSVWAYKIQTTLINLKDVLEEALKAYKASSPYQGEMKKLEETREVCLDEKATAKEILIGQGKSAIYEAMDRVKNCAFNGQPVDHILQNLYSELDELMKAPEHGERLNQSASNIDSVICSVFPEAGKRLEAGKGVWERNSAGGAAAVGMTDAPVHSEGDASGMEDIKDMIPSLDSLVDHANSAITIPPETVPALAAVVGKIIDFFDRSRRERMAMVQAAIEEAQRSQERLAAYYQIVSQVDERTASLQYDWTKRVNNYLQKNYDNQIRKIDQALSLVDRTYSENCRALESIIDAVDSEIKSLSAAAKSEA